MKKVKVGDRIKFKYFDEEIWDTVTEVACRWGLDKNGNPISEDDDYVMTEIEFEVGYNDIIDVKQK